MFEDDFYHMTLGEIADATGLTNQRVSNAVRAGVRKLWQMQVRPPSRESVTVQRQLREAWMKMRQHSGWNGTVGDYLNACRWYESRPPEVRALIDAVPPGSWWRMRDADPTSAYMPVSYGENGTLSLARWSTRWIDGQHRGFCVGIKVFGVAPGDLMPCVAVVPVELTPSQQEAIHQAVEADLARLAAERGADA